MRHRSLPTLVLSRLQRRLGDSSLPLRLVFWDGAALAFGPTPTVTITLRSPRVLRMFLTGNIGRLGQAYVEGEIGVEGRLQDVLQVGVAIAERVGRVPLLRHTAPLLARLRPRHTRRRDAAAIGYHYDVSNEFYGLWLDRHMVYSCAYYRTGSETLDAAQEQKLDHICRKLRLAPGLTLLDIGCGWGGLLHWAAARYGISGVGVTLSERQYEYARARIAAAGLADRVEIRLQDYRDVPGEARFDRIVSVGMYEHVGIANLPTYFGGIARLLKPGGVALNHGITMSDRDGHAGGPPGGEFIDRYVFPGGELPHISRVLYEIAGSGLEIIDVEDLRPHYPPTLLHWLRRLEASRGEVIRIAGEQRYRIWRMYLAGMAYAFDRGLLSVAQVLVCKRDETGWAARPWTREHQYGGGAPAALIASPDWGEL
ncbi:MAG: class I SAM-dependent methyltransferase [Alphaproteobacteria bacterium]|nr:class I SAM-dependent methyltransferase [Alphaproteobacteria bacterium]